MGPGGVGRWGVVFAAVAAELLFAGPFRFGVGLRVAKGVCGRGGGGGEVSWGKGWWPGGRGGRGVGVALMGRVRGQGVVFAAVAA